MRWNKKYDYPKSSRTTEDGIRRYLLGESKLPSVTSVLDFTRSDEEKAALSSSDFVASIIEVTLGNFASPKTYLLIPSSVALELVG